MNYHHSIILTKGVYVAMYIYTLKLTAFARCSYTITAEISCFKGFLTLYVHFEQQASKVFFHHCQLIADVHRHACYSRESVR